MSYIKLLVDKCFLNYDKLSRTLLSQNILEKENKELN